MSAFGDAARALRIVECPLCPQKQTLDDGVGMSAMAKSGLMHRSKQLIAESASVRNSHGGNRGSNPLGGRG